MFSTDVNGTVMTYEDIDDPYFMSIYPTIKPHTITSSFGPVPLWVLYKTIEHIVKHDVPGDIAECGVWNGGSMLLAALALKHFGDLSRKLYHVRHLCGHGETRGHRQAVGRRARPAHLGKRPGARAPTGAMAAPSRWCGR